jgi:hypothetical protein
MKATVTRRFKPADFTFQAPAESVPDASMAVDQGTR